MELVSQFLTNHWLKTCSFLKRCQTNVSDKGFKHCLSGHQWNGIFKLQIYTYGTVNLFTQLPSQPNIKFKKKAKFCGANKTSHTYRIIYCLTVNLYCKITTQLLLVNHSIPFRALPVLEVTKRSPSPDCHSLLSQNIMLNLSPLVVSSLRFLLWYDQNCDRSSFTQMFFPFDSLLFCTRTRFILLQTILTIIANFLLVYDKSLNHSQHLFVHFLSYYLQQCQNHNRF